MVKIKDPELIDFRSDFLTRPTETMIAAMSEAARKPTAFGLREDANVQAIESQAAQLLGKADALFCPTCTQANQIAIHLLTRPGTSVIAIEDAHIFTSEGGALSALSGVVPRPVSGKYGVIDESDLRIALRPGDTQRSSATLLVLENTHVRSGGCVVSNPAMQAAYTMARDAKLPVHLDGSRLANAALFANTTMAELAAGSASVAMSMNKGLGAPLGAVLAGSTEFINQAEIVRQRFGGGWRPAGIMAAAARVALDDWEARLGRDHVHAKQLALALHEIGGVNIDLKQVQTNLVLAQFEGLDADSLVVALAEQGILAIEFSPTHVRLALYHDLGEPEIAQCVESFRKIAAQIRH